MGIQRLKKKDKKNPYKICNKKLIVDTDKNVENSIIANKEDIGFTKNLKKRTTENKRNT